MRVGVMTTPKGPQTFDALEVICCDIVQLTWRAILRTGVISRGLRGRSPLVKISAHFEGLSPPQNSVIDLAFQRLLALLPKCYDQLCTAIWLLRHLLLLTILYQY